MYNPAVAVKNGRIYVLYRAENRAGGALPETSRIGLASSTDGLHFTRLPEPVFYPAADAQQAREWPGGTEDPRVVEGPDHRYYMTYTAYDGQLARLQVAASPDLRHWTKYGSVFARASGGRYAAKWSKSGSIVSRYEPDGGIVAAKINGRYWVYWGDTQIWAATSLDLIHWAPVAMTPGEKPPVPLRSQALTMPELKIVLPTGTYSAAQVLFDPHDPTKLLQRQDTYFMRPERPYETTDQVNQVVFLEGLARHKSRWFLYYGTADSKIAVATRLVEKF